MKLMKMDFLKQLVLDKHSEPSAFSTEIHENATNMQSPLGILLTISRRKKRLSIEEFSEKSNIDIDEITEIERNINYAPDTRTIYALSNYLRLDMKILSEVAGFLEKKDLRFREKVYQFAANAKVHSDETELDNHIFDQYIKLIHERSK